MDKVPRWEIMCEKFSHGKDREKIVGDRRGKKQTIKRE